QAALHRPQQDVFKLVNHALPVAAAVLLPAIWEVHLPVNAVRYRFGWRCSMAELNAQVVARHQRRDAGEGGPRSRQREEGEGVVNAVQVGPGGNKAGGQQRLDLRREEQPVPRRRGLSRPVKRANAEAVAGEVESLAAPVPQADCELSAQPLECPLAMLLP